MSAALSVGATTESRLTRQEPVRDSDFPKKLSFPYASFLVSALFNVFFLLWTLTTSVSLCIVLYQLLQPGGSTADNQQLTGVLSVSLLFDLLFFSWRLHNRASAAGSSIGRAAYFREKPAAIWRLCGSSPHHRRLFFRWQPLLRWMLPLDLLAFAICVLPVHVVLQPQQLYNWPADTLRLDAYQQALRIMATVMEVVVALEAVIELFRRCCGPRDTQYTVVWHPAARTPNGQQYRQALLQRTPPHTARGRFAFAPPASEHPVHPPPAYEDIEHSYSMPPAPPPHLQQYQYPQPHSQQQQQQQHMPYYQQQLPYPYMPNPMQQHPYPAPHQPQSQPQPQPHQQHEEVEGAEQVEGRPREGKVDDERAEGQVEGVRRQARREGGEGVEGEGGEGGEQGAVTAPLVMMMSPALMDEEGDGDGIAAVSTDGGGGAALSWPRVMLSARASDADRLEAPNQRPQVLSPPRYAVVHMSST